MSTNTTNYGLIKPEDTDVADLKVFVGQNMDTIDSQLKTISDSVGGGGSAIPSGIRYIRDTTNGSSVNGNNYWSEIQAIDSAGTNQALNKTVTISAVPLAGTSTLITDGVIGNSSGQYVALPTGTQWAQIDLGSVMDITTINIYRYWLDSRIFYDNLTQVSEDGQTWYTIWDSAINGTYAETSSGNSISVNITSSTKTDVFKSAFKVSPYSTLAVGTTAGKVNFTVKDYDILNEFDTATNYRFTVTETGLYLVSASILMASTASSPHLQMFLYKNGTNLLQLGNQYGSGTVAVGVSNSVPLRLHTGDYLEIYAQSSVALTTTNGISTNGSWFSAVNIAQ